MAFPLSDTLWVPIVYPSPFMGKPFLKKNCVDLYTQQHPWSGGVLKVRTPQFHLRLALAFGTPCSSSITM